MASHESPSLGGLDLPVKRVSKPLGRRYRPRDYQLDEDSDVGPGRSKDVDDDVWG